MGCTITSSEVMSTINCIRSPTSYPLQISQRKFRCGQQHKAIVAREKAAILDCLNTHALLEAASVSDDEDGA